MKRMKQFMSATLGMFILGVVFTSTAMASHSASFVITNYPSGGFVAPASVNVQDTSSNPNGDPLVIEWDCNYDGYPPDFQAEATGSTATCYYPEGGTYHIGERVTAHGQPLYDGRLVTIGSASDAPADIQLAGPTSVGLAHTFEFLSPKPNLDAYCTMQLGGSCAPKPVGTIGPDGGGLYHHLVRVPVSKLDGTETPDIELAVWAWAEDPSFADRESFPINVTGNTVNPFGELTAHVLSSESKAAKCIVSSEMRFFMIADYRWKITLKAEKDGEWHTVKQAHSKGKEPGSYAVEQVHEADKALSKGTRVKATQQVKGFYKKSEAARVKC
jgi:hypothetical protein